MTEDRPKAIQVDEAALIEVPYGPLVSAVVALEDYIAEAKARIQSEAEDDRRSESRYPALDWDETIARTGHWKNVVTAYEALNAAVDKAFADAQLAGSA